MKHLMIALTLAFVGCAGSPVGISNSPDAREMGQGSESIFVRNDSGVWQATYRDYLAKFVFVDARGLLTRKMGLTAAIESASGCKVIDSTLDNMNITMHASVSCPAKVLSPASTAVNASSARAEPESQVRPVAGGTDALQAERFARQQSCSATPRAVLAAKGAGYETYSVACGNGDAIMVRCEFGNCRLLR